MSQDVPAQIQRLNFLQSQVALQHTCSSYFLKPLRSFSRQEHEQGLRETASPKSILLQIISDREERPVFKVPRGRPICYVPVLPQLSCSLWSVLAKGQVLLLLPGEQAHSSSGSPVSPVVRAWLPPIQCAPNYPRFCEKQENCSPVQCFFVFL